MALWRVDVGGVSHRYVDAPDRPTAVRLVADSLLASLDLRASPANPTIGSAYAAAGPTSQKRLLASLDGLINPRTRESSRFARRRLARIIRQDRDIREWISRQVASAPPMADPDGMTELVCIAEVRHIERNLNRLREWERQSPLHE